MLAPVAQENIFCAACAMTGANLATAAKVLAAHPRNTDAKPEYFRLASASPLLSACAATTLYHCVACVTAANR